MTTMTFRCYDELSELKTFKDRFEYLNLKGRVGEDTFGFDRYLNQNFYSSYKWKKIRDQIIIRDMGCDLGLEGYEIFGKLMIHHMNPITKDDVLQYSDLLVDPQYLITVSYDTHNAIHYGNSDLLVTDPLIRRPNDTAPWRR